MEAEELIKELQKLPKNAEIRYASDNGYSLPINEVRKSKVVSADYFLVGMINNKVLKMIK